MKIIVTGATGFIGKLLVEYLVARGDDVIALIRKETDKQLFPDHVTFALGDICDEDSLGNAGAGCDYLFHLAGMITFDPSQRNDLIRVNGRGTETILTFAEKWGVKRSVVVSSACTSGLSFSCTELMTEDSNPDKDTVKRNPYMESKVMQEKAAFSASRKQDVVVVNPTTVYGPGDSSLNSGSLIKKLYTSSLVPVPPGGSNVIDVADVVRGILAAADHGMSGKKYILGNENLQFASIFSAIEKVTGCHPVKAPLPPWMKQTMGWAAWCAGKLTDSRFMTPQIIEDLFAYKYYSNLRAVQELSWTPEFSFVESVSRAWGFYQSHHLI
jgi:dihydroflavonol-4-reductase